MKRFVGQPKKRNVAHDFVVLHGRWLHYCDSTGTEFVNQEQTQRRVLAAYGKRARSAGSELLKQETLKADESVANEVWISLSFILK